VKMCQFVLFYFPDFLFLGLSFAKYIDFLLDAFVHHPRQTTDNPVAKEIALLAFCSRIFFSILLCSKRYFL